jgi:predicted dehydrogenase
MVERERLDILSVATYAPVHAEIVVHCAKHGRAIYCEKPIATRLADAQQMTDACDAAGTLLAINHNRRYNPNYRRLRDLISAGGLGDLTSVNVQWGSGRLGNVGTHLFDAVRMLTGREVQAVSGTLDLSGRPDCRGPQFRDPGGWGLLKLDGGLIATVDAADYGRTPVSITLNGTKGRATTGGGDVRIEFWNGEQEHWQNLRDEATSMDRAVAEIVACLDGAAPFSNPATEAVRTLEVIVGFHASHRRNACWTELPLSDDGRAIEVNSG